MIEKDNVYEIKADLKFLLKEIIEARGIEIYTLASIVMGYIYKYDELRTFFEEKINLYNEIKEKDNKRCQFNVTEDAIKLGFMPFQPNKILENKLREHKTCRGIWDCEYSDILSTLQEVIPPNKLQRLNKLFIFDGIYNYYNFNYFAANIATSKLPVDINMSVTTYTADTQTEAFSESIHNKMISLYDYYYLQDKEQHRILSCDFRESKLMLLKVAIIKVLNDFIAFNNIQKKGNTQKDTPQKKVKNIQQVENFINNQPEKAEWALIYLIIDNVVLKNKELQIVTQEDLIEAVYGKYSSISYNNAKSKLKSINDKLSYMLPPQYQNLRSAKKTIMIVKKLLEEFL